MRQKRSKKTPRSVRERVNEKRKASYGIWALMVIAFLLAAGAGMLFASSSLFDKTVRTIRPQPGTTNTPLLVATDKATVMIMGVDSRDDDIGRSDTLMLATIDPKKKRASLFSIPRDTRAYLPGGYGYEKINVAYSLGGWRLTRDTVEGLLDTPIDHYVLINTRAFPRIIDAIGGVDIDVEKRMEYVDVWDDAVPGGLVIDLYPGQQHMNGVTAMSYVRYRDEEGDIGRIARQQKFMKAVMDQVMSPSIIPLLPSIISECMRSIETDLSFRQLLELAGALKEAQSNGLKTEMLAGEPVYIDEISYWIPDIEDARLQMASMLGITMSEAARAEMHREHEEYRASIPANAIRQEDIDNGTVTLGSERSRSKPGSTTLRIGNGTTPSMRLPQIGKTRQDRGDLDDREDDERRDGTLPRAPQITPDRATMPGDPHQAKDDEERDDGSFRPQGLDMSTAKTQRDSDRSERDGYDHSEREQSAGDDTDNDRRETDDTRASTVQAPSAPSLPTPPTPPTPPTAPNQPSMTQNTGRKGM